ncbi:hypothetical protein [Streptomyces sp. NPDC090798]|uniref:hypothetical protein n=1 Tax=Streptomyces sp. NPDC090798 TaxID=3365968 RepID=UPI0037FD261B
MTRRAAQAVHGEDLVRIGRLIPALLYSQAMDRRDLAAAHERGDRDRVPAEVGLQVMGCRDDLPETAVVLDVLALCRPPGGRASTHLRRAGTRTGSRRVCVAGR